MSLTPGTPDARSQSGAMTPGTIATTLSKMDFPAPTGLRLNLPTGSRGSKDYPATAPLPEIESTGDISGPEPEAITLARRKTRSESMSEQLSERLAHMKLPQPERIFGPDDSDSAAVEGEEAEEVLGEAAESKGGKGKPKAKAQGVTPDQWDKIKLDDDVPESVRTGKMTHSRNASRVDAASISRPAPIPEQSEQAEASQQSKPTEAAREQKITPFDVEGEVDASGKNIGINYEKIMVQFGASKITPELLARFEQVTGQKPHPLLRRGTFFSHRDLNTILDRYEQGKPFYLYTGRGPSSGSLHMGHLVPFMFTAWLQKVFNVPLVIQITDDEKYLLERDVKKQAEMLKKIKGKKPIDLLKYYQRMAVDNIKDIIACGFILEKTYVFQDSIAMGGAFYQNVVLFAKTVTLNQSRNTFGFGDSDNIGMYHFAAVQACPSFSNSFPQIFGERTDIPCLIPCAIDQDPYFLLTRDAADKLGYQKPCLIHSVFLPALQGATTKMSASNENTAIFMTDDPKKIHKKIRSHAFSGGRATQEEHQRLGGDPDVDIAYTYLSFFEESDEVMEGLAREYRAGTLSTVEMKDVCIKKLQEVVAEFQKNRALVTDEMVKQYQDATRTIDPSPRKAS